MSEPSAADRRRYEGRTAAIGRQAHAAGRQADILDRLVGILGRMEGKLDAALKPNGAEEEKGNG